eukprot:Rmarinus@m.5688
MSRAIPWEETVEKVRLERFSNTAVSEPSETAVSPLKHTRRNCRKHPVDLAPQDFFRLNPANSRDISIHDRANWNFLSKQAERGIAARKRKKAASELLENSNNNAINAEMEQDTKLAHEEMAKNKRYWNSISNRMRIAAERNPVQYDRTMPLHDVSHSFADSLAKYSPKKAWRSEYSSRSIVPRQSMSSILGRSSTIHASSSAAAASAAMSTSFNLSTTTRARAPRKSAEDRHKRAEAFAMYRPRSAPIRIGRF